MLGFSLFFHIVGLSGSSGISQISESLEWTFLKKPPFPKDPFCRIRIMTPTSVMMIDDLLLSAVSLALRLQLLVLGLKGSVSLRHCCHFI